MAYSFEKEDEKAFRDSLYKVNKFAELKIIDNKNNTKEFTMVKMPLNESSMKQFDNNGYPLPFDLDYKYIVFHSSNDWAIIDNAKFGKIFIDPKSLINPFGNVK